MAGADRPDITQLLEDWAGNKDGAFDRLAPAVYDHLHEVAQSLFAAERRSNTLQATGLVHELFLRLMQSREASFTNRAHFYVFAAKVMRRILIDNARKAGAKKRGERAQRVTLVPELAWVDAASGDVLDLERALHEFGDAYPEKVRTLELRFFLGATAEEVAELLGQSRSQVNRDIGFSVSWLHRRLNKGRPAENPVTS
ncbi:MAG: sigma-70 family RNA polymerase sigma factor [Acidobacteria bacterium]|nr:sigma-70 family RNA polymerase sigma factor [Acidobacteriota bacterium]